MYIHNTNLYTVQYNGSLSKSYLCTKKKVVDLFYHNCIYFIRIQQKIKVKDVRIDILY